MIFEILQDSEKTWRNIARLATPLDSEKKVNLGKKPRIGDLEAYTDDVEIYINVDAPLFRKNFENIIIPAYKIASEKLYGVSSVSDLELLKNLTLDTFLFIHFHEQLHPWLCPNSEEDRKNINKALYEGIKEAEPSLSESQVMTKVNNSKNLIWDTVINASFLHKTGNNEDILANKIKFVFTKNNRVISSSPITNYPQGILPILYTISANNRTTDAPISLVGSFYTTLSYNDANLRSRALDFFLEDLKSKRIPEQQVMQILKNMYEGLVDKLSPGALEKKGIKKTEYLRKLQDLDNLASSSYEANQKYFISSLTKIFDAPSLRYDSLKGFIKVLSPYISLSEKQGSPDPNTTGGFPGGGGGGGQGKGQSEGEGAGESEGEEAGEEKREDKGKGKGAGKSQGEMDENSIIQTLDDLIGALEGKDANDLMGDAANSGVGVGGSGRGAGAASGKSINKRISIIAADEYYKRNAEIIEVRNPSEEMESFDIGDKKRWKLIRSSVLTAAEVSKLNHSQLINFQRKTGLPVLIEAGGGFYKLNEYVLETLPLKSYSFQKTGIEIPNNWVLFQDSSGTMTGSRSYVGSGNRFDILNRIKYGLKKGLYKVCKELSKDLKFGVVDFSDVTRYRGLESLVKIYEARTHPIKEVSLIPQCGGTQCNHAVFKGIEKELAPGKSIYTFITDGQIYGDTNPLYREIKNFSSLPNHSFVFVEIAEKTPFGSSIKELSKHNPSVLFYHVSRVQDIKDKLSSVLIKYT